MKSHIIVLASLLLVAQASLVPPLAPSSSASVPQFVLDYGTSQLLQPLPTAVPDLCQLTHFTIAPLVFLDDNEKFFPGDIGKQLEFTTPQVNFTTIPGLGLLTLDNLNELNKFSNNSVFLTAKDDITDFTQRPEWIRGVKPNAQGVTEGAVSSTIIIREHPNGSGITDAFYFFFYPFNDGGRILGIPEDNHVGDWENCLIRFKHGIPKKVFLSQHTAGEAFQFNALQKMGKRPVIFSAVGGHANYATAGKHNIPFTVPNIPLNLSGISIPGIPPSVIANLNVTQLLQSVLPKDLLQDTTSNGTLWDPIASAFAYNYTFNFDPNRDATVNNHFTPLRLGSHSWAPTSWLTFFGKWGDEEYPLTDPRQFAIANIESLPYVGSGPTGPVAKNLARKTVCPDSMMPCTVKTSLDEAL